MSENLNLVEILKNCPKGIKLYSTLFGEVEVVKININSSYPIVTQCNCGCERYTKDGKILYGCNGECVLFPSKDQRDWSKFTAPCYNLEKQGEDKKEINNFDVLPGLYKCIHRMFDGTPDGRLLFEIGNVYKCLSKHNKAEFEVSYGHSVYLEDPIVCRYFIPFESKVESKFDPKTLQPFDRVLARIDGGDAYCWFADFVSTPVIEKYDILPCIMSNKVAKMIIPYNDETKHLVGTNEEAPEFYRYWKD